MHVCPAFVHFPQIIRFAAVVKSALSSMIQGLLPPNSSVTGMRLRDAAYITMFPNA